MNPHRLTRNALLTATALILFTVEAQIPVPVALPGVKPGLANIVTVCAVYLFGAWDALCILLCRIVLGSLFAGHMLVLFYSLSGGLCSWLTLCAIRRLSRRLPLWFVSVLAAVAHNAGQIAAAVFVMRTVAVLTYFPFLALSGMLTGLFTGLCAQFLISRRLTGNGKP